MKENVLQNFLIWFGDIDYLSDIRVMMMMKRNFLT